MAYKDFKNLLLTTIGDARGWTAVDLVNALSVENHRSDSKAIRAFRRLRWDARFRACQRAIRERGMAKIARVGAQFIKDRLDAPSYVTRALGK